MRQVCTQCSFPGHTCQQCKALLVELIKTRPMRDLRWGGTGRTYIFSRQFTDDISKEEVRRITNKAHGALMSIYFRAEDPVRIQYSYHPGIGYTKVHLMVDIPSRGELWEDVMQVMFEASGQEYSDWMVAEPKEHTLRRRLQFLQGRFDPSLRLVQSIVLGLD
ncbi:hypothetical protein BDV12DRAFT_199458 [Aspergillus spectabilis]